MKRLIAVSLLIIALPFMASVNSNQSAAYAGRISVGGAYCTCEYPGCILDPGECDGHNSNSAPVAGGGDSITPKGSIDSPSGVMLAALALLLMLRFGLK
ncbi:MAG TPA: hypothetical protein VLR90_07745 [Blastocatellia bacterium]|nr:hypothetical protein [Blastocatellia bacterium]